ncbi:hypothetical protein DOTSEDRAFT_82542 [Dothistroma septosporum NZE10]|uniref:Peptidase S33 tripeptidyl aminopeptidase-like C-terminal domain-containing protein n=1 Tax=Dothistroma septosporum (strain NZE10 / CBS 128990) TaxID=675120 RepID=N1PG47_DOTSN|nr:hypothetical protein DOTSEDRAFT_82542 [Dothistroma septosporum NZE10]
MEQRRLAHTVKPAKLLTYHDCYDGFQCARLDVPLNWKATEEERERYRAAIALIKLPARVSVTHASYGGMILVNPGGPGESGVDQVLDRGHAIQTIVDSATDTANASANDRYFDIIGFDPRGVKHTTPSLRCFSDAFSQQVWLLERPGYGEIYESDSSFALEWARTKALGQSCTSGAANNGIVRYANTAQVVEDMLEIVERHGEWREQHLVDDHCHGLAGSQQVLRSSAFERGTEMMNYWGVSYGSLLGQTFAAMHPDRVGRLVIDGIPDPEDYYFGRWLANLQDSDKVMRRLCEYCFEAGPAKCPLYTGSSADDIEDLLSWLMVDLKDNPNTFVASSSGNSDPMVITFDDFYLQAINAMAFPNAAAEDFFDLLNQLHRGNVTKIAASKQAQLDVAASLASCRHSEQGCFPGRYFGLLGPTPVIECMDSAPYKQKDITKEEFKSYYQKLQQQSEWFSPSWARHRMSCIGIKEQPAWQYNFDITGDTAHPVLIIGNTHNTVTPIANARKVAKLFPGSVVLQQDSQGHCSHAMPSTCTAKYVREYFQTGEIPKADSICQPDYLPFIGKRSSSHEASPSIADDAIGRALEKLSESWVVI